MSSYARLLVAALTAQIIADFGIAQRLKSDDEVLTTLAGSPG